MKKPTFERNPDIDKLAEFLAPRQQASYAEMSVLLQREINGRDRHVLTSARRMLERKGVIFAVQRGIGLVRASNGQVAALSTDIPIRKIRKETQRARKRQAFVNSQMLDAEARLAFWIGQSVINVIKKNTSKSLRTMLAKEIERRDGGAVSLDTVLSLPRHRGAKK